MEPRQHGHLDIEDADIYYRLYGKGEKTILFLHGNGEDWTCFSKQIDEFAQEYTVITMDSRGHRNVVLQLWSENQDVEKCP